MADLNTLFGLGKAAPSIPDVGAPALSTYEDEDLLKLWKDIREECVDPWPVFERQWQRNILYVLGRQWIEYYASSGWRDKRLAQWVPRPVTNKCKETVQAIRAMFSAIKLGANVRPNGADPKDVSAAATGDELQPILHESHKMQTAQNEADFWLLTCGNAFLHTYVDYNIANGMTEDPSETCLQCDKTYKTSEIADAGNACPDCGATAFTAALDEAGQPIVERKPKGRPTTTTLSPLELTMPNEAVRFSDVPYVVRRRWRSKRYYESHPVLKDLVPEMSWTKSSGDPSLQLFKNLSRYNDMGLGVLPSYLSGGISGNPHDEGITEYEVWMKPTEAYPDGLVFRVAGEKEGPKIIHLEEAEALPGPLPYKDADGAPLFTFTHMGYEHVGGRILASGPLDVAIQKQDQINQVDSSILLNTNRMSNNTWLVPKGAEPTKITGMPGLVIEWNAMAFGGTAKPERLEGIGPHPSLFQIREQYLRDFEELVGTFDIMKGQKPSGVEAFTALQLLKEVSQSRFSSVFVARGGAYADWLKFALELEREFGPDERTKAVLSPARRWTFESFKRAQLQGSISVVVEDGSNVPKTSLGMRAALDHGHQLGLVNLQDPDQQYEGLKLMGLTKMVPSLDLQVQSALQKQEAFEEWAANPMQMQQSLMRAQGEMQQFQQQLATTPMEPGMSLPTPPSVTAHTPLKWLPWYSGIVHRQEFLKWANSDNIRELLQQQPALEAFLVTHLQEIEQGMLQQAQFSLMLTAPVMPMEGAGRAMTNSNQESTTDLEPKGTGQGAQNSGPA